MTTRRKRPYHHGNLREALLDAAQRLLEADGEAALALRRIAREVGVSHAASYHHFASREDLLRGLTERGFDRFGAALREAATSRPGAEGFAEMGVAYVTFAARHPALFRLLFGPESAARQVHPEVAAAAHRAFGQLRFQAAAAAPGDDVEIRRRALAAWSVVHGLASLVVDGQLRPLGLASASPEGLARALLTGAPLPRPDDTAAPAAGDKRPAGPTGPPNTPGGG